MTFDAHTHHLPEKADSAIFSCCMYDSPLPDNVVFLAAGIHPWHLSEEDFPMQMKWIENILADKRIVALGESGLDKLCNTPFELQIKAFHFIITLSEQEKLPVFIHCVKAFNEIIALKKSLKPKQSWIIHGFRGKKELAESLIRNGFILSFGEKYHPEALQSVPKGHYLLETDNSNTDISFLYEKAAATREIPCKVLAKEIKETVDKLFFNRIKNSLFGKKS